MRAKPSFITNLMQGSGLLLAANLVSKALTILMLPLLTALLPPALYGEAALATTLISLASMLALAGMDISYARAYFGVEGISGQQVETLIWRRGYWHAGIAAFLSAQLWLLYSQYQGLHAELAVLIAFGVMATLFAALAQVRARLLGAYRRMAASLLTASLLAYISMYLLALTPETAVYALVTGTVLLAWVSGVLLKTPSLRRVLHEQNAIDAGKARQILAVGWPVMITAPAFWIVGSADRWFLGAVTSATEVGIYAIGVSFGTLGMMLNSAVLSAWVPEVIREYEHNTDGSYHAFGQAKRLLILAYAFVWMAITILSPELVGMLVDARYHDAIAVVPWIAGGVFFYGCAHLFNTVFLLERKMGTMAAIWTVATVLSLACNAWVVPRHGMVGAAVVQCLVFAVAAVMQWWFSQKIQRISVFTPMFILQLWALCAIGYFGQNWQFGNILYTLAIKLFALAALGVFILWGYSKSQTIQISVDETS
jgi:O-antigen/teichoic acid export membrane protein